MLSVMSDPGIGNLAHGIAYTVTIRLHLIENVKSMWIVVFRAAAEEHVVVHLPRHIRRGRTDETSIFCIKSNSQTINSETQHQQNSHSRQRTRQGDFQHPFCRVDTEVILS